jgi:hypothetical protein
MKIRLGKILQGIIKQGEANKALSGAIKGRNVTSTAIKNSAANLTPAKKELVDKYLQTKQAKTLIGKIDKEAAAKVTEKGTGAGSKNIRATITAGPRGMGAAIKNAFAAGKTDPRAVITHIEKNSSVKVNTDTISKFLEKAVDPKKKAVAAKMLKIANKPSGKKAVGQTIKQEKLKGKAKGGLINRRYGGMIGNKSSGHNGNDLVAAGYTKIA